MWNPSKNLTRCSRCGAPEALLVRRYSGEALCRRCLRASLLTRMRRFVSKNNLLSRNDHILMLRTELPYDKELSSLFFEMESEFPVSIDSAKLGFHSREEIPEMLREVVEFFSFRREKVILPLILDDVVSLLMRFIFTGSPDFLIISGRLHIALSKIENFVAPFVEVPLEEILALCGDRCREVGTPNDPYLRMVEELERDSPGIRFNLLRFTERTDFLRAVGVRSDQ